jgi:microsomal dipeptidase-like Zn-dependent dipeptidase/anthranilate/para-aminobenzoate synthase component II
MQDFNWTASYDRLNTGFKPHNPHPLIGITGNYSDLNTTLGEAYYRSVLEAGGIPVVLPPHDDLGILKDLIDSLDGILLSGGADLNPLFVGEEPIRNLHAINYKRDLQELVVARLAYDRQLPMLGICRGIQLMVAALGGSIYQDIYTQISKNCLKHTQELDRATPSHSVTLAPDSLLHELFKADTIYVNSFHHQAVKDVPPCLKVTATSPDGVIEAVESTEFKSVLGVQWHPEAYCMAGKDDMRPIFNWLVKEANSFKAAKRLHQRIISLDSHCDTPMFFHQQIDFSSRDPRILVDLHKMTEGHLDATIMVAYLKQLERDDESLLNATAKANQILTQIEDMVAKNCTAVDIAYRPNDILRLKREGKKAIMLGVENGYAIGKDIRNVEKFRQRGVVYMTLCHNGDNDICDSAKGQCEHGGVSEFGAEVIKEMNRVGMMVDLSHAAESSFFDALDISSQPIVCSHSSSRALCDHPRNLTDEQMRRLADKGGVAQITFYNGFLRKEGEANILDAINHLNHAVNVMGIEHVGIGTDFDGDGGIRGCASASELINFTRRLLLERYTEQQIEMIWGGNFLRVMQQVQEAAKLK